MVEVKINFRLWLNIVTYFIYLLYLNTPLLIIDINIEVILFNSDC